ncbi:hypothetical protein LIER_13086 [Lithospermum erythrorhizon]|uniref:RNase H type-1 domain-containing protein n=1 Tax=Lithospermum erythrorhizon TaxID=34254 RepID=A0AAV3PU42_LITER
MQPPRKYKDIQKLTGCLATLSWFISKSDGARNEKGSGARILVRGPGNIVIEYALRFTFPTTNNEEEYEVMVAGLTIVKLLGISRICVNKLVMGQVRSICGVKHDQLVKYHARAIQLAQTFEHILFEYIPRAQNEEVDHLSRLTITYYDELPQGVYVEVLEALSYQEVVTLSILKEPED